MKIFSVQVPADQADFSADQRRWQSLICGICDSISVICGKIIVIETSATDWDAIQFSKCLPQITQMNTDLCENFCHLGAAPSSDNKYKPVKHFLIGVHALDFLQRNIFFSNSRKKCGK